LDRVADPGNLGTIIRLCDSVGFNTLILTKGSADCYNEKVIRSTMGSIFNVNIHYLESVELIKQLKNKNYKIFVTALDTTAITYNKIVLESKNAIVFGNEGVGVSKEILEIADSKVYIPIYGGAESLNVGVASGIVLYKVRELIK
jgi:TrmH family RNA methyltransferase